MEDVLIEDAVMDNIILFTGVIMVIMVDRMEDPTVIAVIASIYVAIAALFVVKAQNKTELSLKISNTQILAKAIHYAAEIAIVKLLVLPVQYAVKMYSNHLKDVGVIAVKKDIDMAQKAANVPARCVADLMIAFRVPAKPWKKEIFVAVQTIVMIAVDGANAPIAEIFARASELANAAETAAETFSKILEILNAFPAVNL